MAKDPAFLFYPSDFISGTQYFNLEEKGAYIQLLLLQFNEGKLTDFLIRRSLGEAYERTWEIIKCKFIFDGSHYWNERLEIEKQKRAKFTESRRNNLKSTPHMAKHMDAHMEDVNENTNEDLTLIVLNENEDRFFEFWYLYDKKVRKPATQKQWDKLTEVEKQKVLDITPAYVKSKPEKQYRLDPERFLKYKSFNDEIIEAKNGTNKNNGGASPEFLRELVTKRAEKERG